MPETLHRGFLIRRLSRDDVQNQKLASVGEEGELVIKPKRFIERVKCVSNSSCIRHSGGYSVGVPPLPIPNREVKPVRADGTAYSGRVGSRRPFKSKCRFGESFSSAALLFLLNAAILFLLNAAFNYLPSFFLSLSAVLLIALHFQVGCFRMITPYSPIILVPVSIDAQ